MGVVVVGLSLAVLHGVEAALWAGAYLSLGALDTPAEAMLFSVDSMTTRGASGLAPHQHWQVIGALEAVAGMLMFGISTAYMFFVMQFIIGRRYRRGGCHRPHLRDYVATQLSRVRDGLTRVVTHNDAAVQPQRVAVDARLKHWGVPTIGTELGNARCTNR
jgi:hypothetical protein